jgi:hypothetical protein
MNTFHTSFVPNSNSVPRLDMGNSQLMGANNRNASIKEYAVTTAGSIYVSLFNDVVSSHYMASNCMTDNEMKRLWKEMAVA